MRRSSTVLGLLASLCLASTLLAAPAQAATAGTTTVLPKISQPGSGTAQSKTARWVVQAKFTSSLRQKGRSVEFFRYRNGKWSKACNAKQDAGGYAICRTVDATSTWKARTARSVRWTNNSTKPAWRKQSGFEFGGKSLPKEWTHRQRGYLGGSRTCSSGQNRAVTVGSGKARLRSYAMQRVRLKGCKAKASDGRYYKFANSHIATQPIYGPTGMASARIKFDSRRGAHGAFWLQEADGAKNAKEIDVIESFGSGSNPPVRQFIHAKSGSATASTARIRAAYAKGHSASSRYHVYSVEWTPKQYIFRIDGIETFRTTRYPSSDPHMLILSNLSSDWELKANNPRNTHNMWVDWVTYWRK